MPARLRLNYGLATLTLFFVEVSIALFVHDRFIRPYLGDSLVVVLSYSFLRALGMGPAPRIRLGVLLFAFSIETLQAIDFAHYLGADRPGMHWLGVVLGRSFAWSDFPAYFLGYVLIGLDPWQKAES